MYSDAEKLAKACPECAVAMGTGRKKRPPLHPIPVLRPFQILGIDVMDLPVTEKGNRHVIVIQDLFTKWPLVFPVPDQKASRIAKLVVEEVVPLFGVPESLLSDRGTNLLSCLVLDVCKMLGITKLNTTAYHPQCDGAVERFNRTLKTILRKHAARFGNQWDTYLPGVLWAYRNTPHTSTKEKPSFLLFGLDCRSPTEAAFLPTADINPTDVCDYREELMLTLSSARELAARNIQRAQKRYKDQYDKRTSTPDLRIGEWVLVQSPQDESGRLRKLSRPWHGPYRITRKQDPDVTVVKVYYPQHGETRVHQSRVCACPTDFPAGYYWYGGKRKGPRRPPKWVDQFLSVQDSAQCPDRTEYGGEVDKTMPVVEDVHQGAMLPRRSDRTELAEEADSSEDDNGDPNYTPSTRPCSDEIEQLSTTSAPEMNENMDTPQHRDGQELTLDEETTVRERTDEEASSHGRTGRNTSLQGNTSISNDDTERKPDAVTASTPSKTEGRHSLRGIIKPPQRYM